MAGSSNVRGGVTGDAPCWKVPQRQVFAMARAVTGMSQARFGNAVVTLASVAQERTLLRLSLYLNLLLMLLRTPGQLDPIAVHRRTN